MHNKIRNLFRPFCSF